MRRLAPVMLIVGLSACSASSVEAPTVTDPVAEETSTTSAAPVTADPVEISVVVGENSSSERTEKVALGSPVTVTLVNPESRDEFHLHGYDIATGTVEAGEESVISFTADKAGTFEIESHVTGEVLVSLEIR